MPTDNKIKSPDLSECNRRFGKNNFAIENRENGAFEITVKNPSRRDEVMPMEPMKAPDGEIEISFSSDAPIMRFGEAEILSHEEGDYSFARLMEVGSILRNHDAEEVCGVPTKIWLEVAGGRKKGKLKMRFGTTECAMEAYKEVVEDKTVRGVSVGYLVNKWIFLADESVEYKGMRGPAWVATSWEAMEASFTPIPADPNVGVNRAIEKTNEAVQPAQEKTMSDNDKRAAAEKQAGENVPAAPVVPATDKRSDKNEAKSELARVREIERICRKAGIDDAKRDEFIEKDSSVEDVRKFAFETVTAKSAPVGAQVVSDGRDSLRAAAIDGLLLRSGEKIEKPAAGANDFRGMSLPRMAEECLRRAGIAVPHDVREMVKLATRGAETIVGATSDFPYILANTANKALLQGYAIAQGSYQFWASIGSLNDFKQATRVKFSEVGKLKLVTEGGKYTETALSDKRETIQLGTYARKFTLSRQAIINDDLGAFTRVPMSFGMQAAQLPNDLAIAVLTANGNMSDGNALFSTAHGNTSSETDRRLDTVAHAQAAAVYMYGMMAQQQSYNAAQESDGRRYLNLKPRIWLVAGTDEIIARQAVVSAADATLTMNSGVQNPLAGLGLQVVADQNIKTSATDYTHFMFADPRLAPVVEVAFLQGNMQPYFERLDQNDADGSVWLVRLDCGAAAVDSVGAVREVGTDG